MTNGDRIRSMSDEQLKDFLVDEVLNWAWCDDTAPIDNNTKICLKGCTCNDCCEEWLKEEVENEV